MNLLHRLAGILLAVAILVPVAARADNDAALWQAARDGRAIIFMRHALAPGTGVRKASMSVTAPPSGR